MTERPLSFQHRFVPGGDGAPALLLLHGTGGDENDLLSLGRALAPTAHLLSPRGKVLENGMPRFFRRVAMGVFDVEDLKARAVELADFIGEATSAYGLDPERIVALGYSNGANIAAGLLLLRPGVLRAAALLHAQRPFDPDAEVDLSGTSVLVTGGRVDQMIAPAETEALVSLLDASGADVHAHWEPGGHELTPAELSVVKRWLEERHLVE